MSIKDFFAEQETYLTELLENAKTATIAPPKNLVKCPNCGKPMRIKKGKTGNFWACTGFPDCKTTFPDKKGANGPEDSSNTQAASTASALIGEDIPDELNNTTVANAITDDDIPL